MSKQILDPRILLIEDEDMVRLVNKQFCYRFFGDDIEIQEANSIITAKEMINQPFDIVLVDNYLEDGKGIDFLEENYEKLESAIIIMITAADDRQTVQRALNVGATDYLVKPYTYERFVSSMEKVVSIMTTIENKQNFQQDDLDQIFMNRNSGVNRHSQKRNQLPKGLTRITLNKVMEGINHVPHEFSTYDLLDEVDLSRITLRKYLDYLVDEGIISQDVQYQTTGRPLTIFLKKTSRKQDLKEL